MNPHDTSTITIDNTDTLNEIVARYPQALPVLHSFGLDTCCGGALTIATAAERHGLDLNELLAALRRVIEGAQA